MRQQPSRRPRREDGTPPLRDRVEEPSPTQTYVWAGVAAAVLIVILVVAFGSSEEPAEKKAPKPKATPMPAAPDPVRPVKPDLGSIVFVCANSGKHDDEEVLLDRCPCGALKKFYVDKAGGGYRCLSCGKIFDNAEVKCPKCGKVAVKTHLRPSFN